MQTKSNSGFWKKFPVDNKWAFYYLPVLLIITFIIYKDLLFADFLDYDDVGNVVQNISVTNFSIQGIKDIFTSSVYYSYNPFTFLSYAIEYQMFGMNPGWFHLTNILLHLINIFLVFRLVSILAKNRGIGLIAAALFALHPMQADVVGWISARSYLLCTLFCLLSLTSYIQYLDGSPKKKLRLILSLIFFVFACLSKSQAITMAPVIILINWLYKTRYGVLQSLVVSIYFFIAVAIGLLTVYFRADLGKTEIIPEYSLIEKVFIICFSMVKYLFKAVYPIGLTAIDAFPAKTASGMLPFIVYISAGMILAVGVIILKFIKKTPLIVFGLLFFFLNVFITQFSFLEDGFCANRYFYLSSAGLFLTLAVLCMSIYRKAVKIKYWLIAGGFTVLVFLALITYSRSGNWKNTLTLSSSIIENSPQVTMAYNIRGTWYYRHQQYELSVKDYGMAISIFPGYSSAYFNRALSSAAMQDHTSALSDYNRAIELNPNFVSAFIGRGILFLDVMKDYQGALDDFSKAVSLDPSNARAYYNRGLAYLRMTNVEEACKNWNMVKALGYSQADQMIARFCR